MNIWGIICAVALCMTEYIIITDDSIDEDIHLFYVHCAYILWFLAWNLGVSIIA